MRGDAGPREDSRARRPGRVVSLVIAVLLPYAYTHPRAYETVFDFVFLFLPERKILLFLVSTTASLDVSSF